MRFPPLAKWMKRFRKPPKHFLKVLVVAGVSAIPADCGRDFFIVRREGRDLWAAFMCPCGRGHRLLVNLSRSKHPYWRAWTRKNEVSLSPSVWLETDCKSHFIVRDSRVYWAFSHDS
jgi:hypothetical protein